MYLSELTTEELNFLHETVSAHHYDDPTGVQVILKKIELELAQRELFEKKAPNTEGVGLDETDYFQALFYGIKNRDEI